MAGLGKSAKYMVNITRAYSCKFCKGDCLNCHLSIKMLVSIKSIGILGFFMRKISIAAAAFVALSAFCVPASAATIMSTSNGNNQDDKIFGTSMGTVTGKTLSLTGGAGLPVQYLSDDVLKTSGQGFAQVTGNGGGFSDLTITPLANFTFTTFKFDIFLPKATKLYDNTGDFSFTTLVYLNNAVLPQSFNIDAGKGNGSNSYLITADVGEYINKIVIENLETISSNNHTPKGPFTTYYDFDAIKQASFNLGPGVSGVPEPATWAEFILGFGLAGVMLRRRRNQAVPA